MTKVRRFTQLDVFTTQPLLGNPLAVVHDAAGLTDLDMAAFARWTNLSETTFLFHPTEPGADYWVRIFTPGGELPFAGHPTLGSAHAWLLAGGRPTRDGEVVQQCGVGLVRVRYTGARLAFAAPPLRRSGPADDAMRAQVATALRIEPDAIVALEWVDNGPGWLAVMLADADAVLALRPDFSAMHGLKLGIVGPYAAGGDAHFEVRAFVPTLGVPEDPVTGSLNAGLAQWLIGSGRAPARYVARQGRALGRDGRVHVTQEDGDIWIGGDVVAVVQGTVDV
ncbi:MAG: PhzF family phenazine biosynthesis protein [Acidobacteria bacterium]|nr:PhzF family phenazine biosynthesis protein [Acidobacteriota bacterium]